MGTIARAEKAMSGLKILTTIHIFRSVLGKTPGACSSTKFVPQDKYLLDKYSIDCDNKDFNQKELKSYVRQKHNKRILGFKFHLFLYNLSKKDKDNWFNRWLRNIGEEPVIWDRYLTNKSKSQLRTYLQNKGYYNSLIKDTVIYKRKKVKLTYHIGTNLPLTVRSIRYNFEDTSLIPLVLQDSVNSLVKKDIPLDTDILQEERTRIESYLKNLGYYNFSKEYVFFEVDSSLLTNEADIFK